MFDQVSERYLASAVIYDPDRYVPQLREAGISESHFVDNYSKRIWRMLSESYDAGYSAEAKDLEVRIMQSDEPDAREFSVGISDIRGMFSGDEWLKQHTNKVTELQAKRTAYRDAKRLMDTAVDGDIESVSAALQALTRNFKTVSANDKGSEELWEKMQACLFDENNAPPHQAPLIGLNGVGVMWKENIHTLVAQSKAGKTHAKAAMIRTLLTGERTLGFTIDKSITGTVVYLDFEQDAEDFHKVMTLAGATQDRVKAYKLAGLSSKDAREGARLAIEKNPDVEAVFIDGYADLSSDVNSQEEAVALAAEWMALAQEHNVAILGALHLNPGSDSKSRGHLGSQLERKSKVILQIDTDKDGVRETYTQYSRKKEIRKGHGVSWQWCDFEGGFVELNESKSEKKVRERVELMAEKAKQVAQQSTSPEWTHGALVKDITATHQVKESQAKSYIKDWVDNGIITKNERGYCFKEGQKNDTDPSPF